MKIFFKDRCRRIIFLFFALMMCEKNLVFAKNKTQEEGTAISKKEIKKLSAPEKVRLGRWVYNTKFPKRISWKKIKAAKSYVIYVFDIKKKKLILEIETEKNKYIFDRKKREFEKLDDGYYFVRVAAKDKNENIGLFSSCKWTYVGKANELGPRPRPIDTSICSKRDIAAETISEEFKQRAIVSKNMSYSRSQFQVEGASFAMLTDAQRAAREDFTLAMTATLRSMYWLNHRHGFEGSFKSKVTGYNENGNNVSPQSFEGRYHMRFRFGSVILPKLLREFQFSIFAGYELYKNETTGGVEFVNEYNLIKAGAALKVRVWDSWETGGEMMYGVDSGNLSQKLEMQGYLNYYFLKNWSLGVGYRLHLFKTTDTSIIPSNSIIFKEAFGEGYGQLRYSF